MKQGSCQSPGTCAERYKVAEEPGAPHILQEGVTPPSTTLITNHMLVSKQTDEWLNVPRELRVDNLTARCKAGSDVAFPTSLLSETSFQSFFAWLYD